LSDHRNTERQGENAAGEGDPVSNVTSICHSSVATAATALVVVFIPVDWLPWLRCRPGTASSTCPG
jgi:hypothetical protein